MEASWAQQQRSGEDIAQLGEQAADGARPIGVVFVQLLPRIATSMPRNEVACILRLVCKPAAATLRGPEHATVHLSEPAPPAEFQWRWCGPQSLHSTTFMQRKQLEELTARSGVVANLEALAGCGDMPMLSKPMEWVRLLDAGAGAGRLEACRWLHTQLGAGSVPPPSSVAAAAAGGRRDVCEWLLHLGCEWSVEAVVAALEHGHAHLAELLLQRRPQGQPDQHLSYHLELCEASVKGCDLATVQRLVSEQEWVSPIDAGDGGSALFRVAAGSPTADWAPKLEWLVGMGCGLVDQYIISPYADPPCAFAAAAGCTDAVARMEFLTERGYPHDVNLAAAAAAAAGNTAALRYMLTPGTRLRKKMRGLYRYPMSEACLGGSLEAAQLLQEAGCSVSTFDVNGAAERGHLDIVKWGVEQLGDGTQLSVDLFASAATSGSLPLLRWLHEHGCPWNASTWAGAARAGCEAALDWLAERGCPKGEDGAAYEEATRQHDMRTLHCLARLGCPFGPDGRTFTCAVAAAMQEKEFAARLTWLLDAGCPVAWEAAKRRADKREDMLSWLQEQQRLRGG